MAGLIDQAMQASPAPEAPQAPMAPPMPGKTAAMPPMGDEGAEPDENNPQFVAALKFAMQALYKGDGAEGVAKALRAAPDKMEALANTAYEIASITEERTQGAVPDELLGLLGMSILQEVADIAENAGVPLKPSDMAGALKTMILRFLGESGQDTSQLEAAMNEVDPAAFDQMAEEQPA